MLAQDRPLRSELLVDVYDGVTGIKVVSIDKAKGTDRLVNYTRGPWEAAFGFPARGWAPAVAKRLVLRSGRAA